MKGTLFKKQEKVSLKTLKIKFYPPFHSVSLDLWRCFEFAL